jgi:hypothetical protein
VVDPRTVAIGCNKQKGELIRQDQRDNSKRNCSAAWRGVSCSKGDEGDFAILETSFLLGSMFVYWYRGTQNKWELLSHLSDSLDLAPSDYNLFGNLKDHLRGHHYETDKAVQEAVQSWNRLLPPRHFSDSAMLAEMHRSGRRFCRKVIKDA